jgi:hypothetical protein
MHLNQQAVWQDEKQLLALRSHQVQGLLSMFSTKSATIRYKIEPIAGKGKSVQC